MSDGYVNIRGKQYATVALRLKRFNENHPIGQSAIRLLTDVVQLDADRVVVRAWLEDDEGRVLRTGYAEERWETSQINRTSAVENCETSAVGRVLAMAGYESSEIASADEVNRAISQQNTKATQQHADRPSKPPGDSELIKDAVCPNCAESGMWLNVTKKGDPYLRCGACKEPVWSSNRGKPNPVYTELMSGKKAPDPEQPPVADEDIPF